MKKSLIFACFFFAIVCVVGTTTEAQTYTFNNDLRLGNTGQDVANLQTWLIANGYNIPSISSGANTKGYYGFQTMAAVEAYQTAAGLPAYGFFGPITRAYWSSHYGNGGNQGGNSGTSFRVISPNGGEAWALGTTQNITWTGSFKHSQPNRRHQARACAACVCVAGSKSALHDSGPRTTNYCERSKPEFRFVCMECRKYSIFRMPSACYHVHEF